jgi:Domain of unknown function (DUF6471)
MPKAADQDRWTIAAKNILKGELKRRGVTYARLAERLGERGVHENERNLNNKISRGGFTAGFFVMCLEAIGCQTVRLSPD